MPSVSVNINCVVFCQVKFVVSTTGSFTVHVLLLIEWNPPGWLLSWLLAWQALYTVWLLWKRTLRAIFAIVVWENWHTCSPSLVWEPANLSDEALISLHEQVGEHPASPMHTHLGCVAFALISFMISFLFLEAVNWSINGGSAVRGQNGKVTLEQQSVPKGEKLIKDFHIAVSSWSAWPMCLWAGGVRWERGMTQPEFVLQKRSCPKHDSYSISEAIKRCRTFPGKWFEKWQCRLLCNINYNEQAPQIS